VRGCADTQLRDNIGLHTTFCISDKGGGCAVKSVRVFVCIGINSKRYGQISIKVFGL